MVYSPSLYNSCINSQVDPDRNYIGKENIPSGYHWINLAINKGII
jgi:hypothetical protein